MPARSPGTFAVATLVVAVVLGTGCPAGSDGDGAPAAGGDGSRPEPLEFVLPAGAEAAEAAITAKGMLADIVTLSSDAFGGRGPGTEGDRMTREHIVERLTSAGFEPGGPGGSWEQPFDIVGVTAAMPETWEFRAHDEVVSLRWRDEYIASSGVQEPRVSFEDAEVVFVGYGIEASEENWDDFGDADLSGKVLLMLNNDPDWDENLFAGSKRLYYGRWTYKYESAARQGAVGAIVIHTDASAGYGWNVVQSSWSGAQFELPAEDGEQRLLAPAWVTWDAAERLVAAAGQDLTTLVESAKSRDFVPVPLGIVTSLEFDVTLDRTETANVVGILPGSDPDLADEVVVYTAHHDHLGIGEPNDEGDAIYNGAEDNAAGTAQVIAIAEAFAALPERPRRTIMILPVAAEEQGLLGSRYYAQNPTVSPGKIAACVNIDGGNTLGRTKDVGVIGRGKSQLEDLLTAAAALQDRVVVDEPEPDKGYYYRSDQISFAKIGVPALYYKSGYEYIDRPEGWGADRVAEWRRDHYHQPSDEVRDDWDLSGMVEDARLAFAVGASAAQADAMPGWYPGDEFEAARKAAVASVAD